jgi:hypothetical protein
MSVNGSKRYRRGNQVIARFPDCFVAFEMPRGATFADLAERVASYEERMHEIPLSVAVQPSL